MKPRRWKVIKAWPGENAGNSVGDVWIAVASRAEAYYNKNTNDVKWLLVSTILANSEFFEEIRRREVFVIEVSALDLSDDFKPNHVELRSDHWVSVRPVLSVRREERE